MKQNRNHGSYFLGDELTNFRQHSAIAEINVAAYCETEYVLVRWYSNVEDVSDEEFAKCCLPIQSFDYSGILAGSDIVKRVGGRIMQHQNHKILNGCGDYSEK